MNRDYRFERALERFKREDVMEVQKRLSKLKEVPDLRTIKLDIDGGSFDYHGFFDFSDSKFEQELRNDQEMINEALKDQELVSRLTSRFRN